MIRKFIIATMVVSALGVAIAGWISFSRPLVQAVQLTPKLWLVGAVFDGRARLFCLNTKVEHILNVGSNRGPRVDIVVTNGLPFAPAIGWKSPIEEQYFVNLGGRTQVPPFGAVWQATLRSQTSPPELVWNSFVRAPIIVLVIALLAYPAIAFIRGPLRKRRRSKRGLCLHCGYNLTGLPEPRCPECGTAVSTYLPDNSVKDRTFS